ncbi:hypothetical protein [Paracidovorax sp. MALMAid1276]|uniref:hypothetical protein n=1 Tax=Paracidovorax sp. MALMAid1276 TaxID=3411631 RepID=UPI003B9BE08A
MRGMFGMVGLVVVLALVGVLVKKQMTATRAPVQAVPALAPASAQAPAQAATVRDQSQQIQQQVRQQMDTLMQQTRPMPDEEK